MPSIRHNGQEKTACFPPWKISGYREGSLQPGYYIFPIFINHFYRYGFFVFAAGFPYDHIARVMLSFSSAANKFYMMVMESFP